VATAAIPPAVTIGGRLYGLDDAMHASLVLAEYAADRPNAARRLAAMGHVDALTADELGALCSAFGVRIYPLDTLTD